MKRSTIKETIIFLYAILFLYTGISKLIEYDTFKEQLSQSPILGGIASLISILIPAVEFLIVLLLIIPRWRLRGFYAAMALMSAFTIYIVLLMKTSDKLPCSCGGIIGNLSWSQHIVLNIVFILLAACGILLQKKEIKDGKVLWRQPNEISPSMINKGIKY